MADQDPPVGPLRRLDPSEPDETQELGRLEPLDPQAEEPSADPASAAARRSPRLRDGLALAIALAVLLSLSSIAAIGGLVAISVSGMDPAPEVGVAAPIESAASGPPIRVVVPEEDVEPSDALSRRVGSGGSGRSEGGASAPAPAAAPAPAPAPAPPPAPADEADGGGGGGGRKEKGSGGSRRTWGIEGAWCDAAAGTYCDVVVGGPAAPAVDDDQDDEGASASGSSGKGHGKHH